MYVNLTTQPVQSSKHGTLKQCWLLLVQRCRRWANNKPALSQNHVFVQTLFSPPYNMLMVIYHPLYSMNNSVTNESKLPQDGAQVFFYMGWLAIMWPSWEGHMIANHSIYRVIGYHVTLWEGHMIANHPI